MSDIVWWGTYPEAGLGTPTGTGEGLWRQSPSDAVRALELPAPSFMVAHPRAPFLYAVSEDDASAVHVINVEDAEAPRVQASLATGGAGACHVLIGDEARALYVSHYGSGDLVVIPLTDDGHFAVEEPAQRFHHEGSGPVTDRQEASHAHFAGFGPGGHHVLVADLGTDELRRYALRPDGLLDDHGIAAELPGGSGPRHFVVRGEHLYVACELSSTIAMLRWDGAAGEAHTVSLEPATTAPPRSVDANFPSHIVQHGDSILIGVRGSDVIAIHDVSPEGYLHYRGAFDAGHWPRHFAIVGDRLHVGAERGHEVRTYPLSEVEALPPEAEVGGIAELQYASAPMPSPAVVIGHPVH